MSLVPKSAASASIRCERELFRESQNQRQKDSQKFADDGVVNRTTEIE
jgi:hypothetical protein